MTDFMPQPNADGLVKLSGAIRNLKSTRGYASFILTESDQNKLGMVAIGAAVAGLAGQAAAAVSSAGDMSEAADYVEFDLGDKHLAGWLWRNPFKGGDVVDVAAGKTEDHWEIYGVARPSDRIVALYPHCSRGKTRHYWNAFKWWIFGWGGAVIFIGVPFALFVLGKVIFQDLGLVYTLGGLMFFFALMTYSLSRKWLPFVRVAEKVFRTLGLPHPSEIDLVKSSKAQRTPNDPGEFGTFYFRY